MNLGEKIVSLIFGLGSGVATWFLLKYWWDIYNRVYAEITPLQLELSNWAFFGGIVLAFLTLVFIGAGLSRKK